MKKSIALSLFAFVFQTFARDLPEPVLLDAPGVLAAAAEITAEDYPNADTVLVDNLVHTAYRPDGTSMLWDDEYVKILTEKGRQGSGVRRIHFNASYGTAAVVRASIHKPDGRALEIDVAAQSRVMVEPGQMNSNIYDPNQKVAQLTIPGLEVGDTLRVLATRETRKPRVPDFWGDYSVFEYTDPIRRIVYEVSTPPELPLRHKMLRDEIPGTVAVAEEKLDDGRTLLRWQITDVPRMFAEPKMPPLHTVVQRLVVSTAEDWPAISRWYWNLCAPRLAATTPEMTNTVERLTADAGTDMEKVRALFKFVSQEIRYMGITIEDEAPGYEPHDVSLTFENKYGVCRDKAALLAVMLQIAGIEGFPVLIHAGARMDPDVPVPYFNHAITAAKLGGKYVYMDPTDESTKDLLPSYLCRKSCLIAHPEGETLALSPANPVDENLVVIATTGRVDGEGTLSLESQIDFTGINDNAYRGHFLRNKPADRKKLFESYLKAAMPGAEILSFTLTPENLQDTDSLEPLRITLSARAPDWPMRGADGMAAANLPWLGRDVGYANWLLGTTGLDERKYPFETDIACGVHETITLDTGAVFERELELPKTVALDTPQLGFSYGMSLASNTLSAAYQYEMRDTTFTPAQYQALRVKLQDIEHALKQRPLFVAQQDSEADIRVLNASTVIELESRNAWSATRETTVEILTYAGMKRNSEISISFNPVWQTAEIVEAVVSNKNGAVFTIGEKEINLMDAAWAASAPDYPAGKTLVASLPGVEVGSVIRTVVRTTQTDAPFFSHTHTFGGFDPVDAASLEVRRAADMKLVEAEWKNNPKETADPLLLSLSLSPRSFGIREVPLQKTWTYGNIPALRREDGLPALRTLLPTVALSSEKDWKAYSKTLQNAVDPLVKPSREIRAHARNLAAPFKTREEKIKALRDSVLQHIRLAGPPFNELPLSALSTPDATLARGYGHALDRMILLDAMLRAEGFNTEIIFAEARKTPVGESDWPLQSIPQRTAHTVPLVAVLPERSLWNRMFGSVNPNEILHLGDGDQYTPLGATAFADHDALNPASAEIRPVWVAPELKSQSRSETVYDVRPDGDAIITHTVWHYGAELARFRKHYMEQPPEERRREHLELINAFSRGAEPLSELATETEAYPGHITFTLRAPRYAVLGENTMTILLPPPPALPLSLRSDRRYLPMLAPNINSSQKTVRVLVPDGFNRRVVSPTAYAIASRSPFVWEDANRNIGIYPNPPFPWEGRHNVWEGVLNGRHAFEFTYTMRMRDVRVPPEDYPALLEANRKLSHPSQRTLILTR